MPNYHICFTSHKEVMYRDEEDMNAGFNSLCSAMYKTDSACYADAFMSDHHHGCYRTRKPGELVRIARISYAKQFNRKYFRHGPLGEEAFFIQEIDGMQHFLAAVSYVLKNPTHHGVTATPFEYRFSSANCYFRKELGKFPQTHDKLLTHNQIRLVLPRRADFDPKWKMGINGVFIQESVLDVAAVETNFGTAQAFNYYMGRKSGEDWAQEQERDGNGIAPFTLESMEVPMIKHRASSVAEMLQSEKSRHRTVAINDMELCKIIDNQIVPRYNKASVYQLSPKEKVEIANQLYKEFRASSIQIKRCLVF